MRRIVKLCLVAAVLLPPGMPGTAALASAAELQDPMQPPPYALRKFREAKLACQPKPTATPKPTPKPKPLQLTSILISAGRQVAIIDDQMLSPGDSIRGARLVSLTRESARLVRKGKVIKLSLGSDKAAIRKKAVESDL